VFIRGAPAHSRLEIEMPWYLSTPALLILKRLKANPPACEGNTDTNQLMSNAGYCGFDVLALRSLFAKKFADLNLNGWTAEKSTALLNASADEILAGMFGCSDGLDWAHPERAARRAALAMEIDAALAERLAA
jgi:hypothetical protein